MSLMKALADMSEDGNPMDALRGMLEKKLENASPTDRHFFELMDSDPPTGDDSSPDTSTESPKLVLTDEHWNRKIRFTFCGEHKPTPENSIVWEFTLAEVYPDGDEYNDFSHHESFEQLIESIYEDWVMGLNDNYGGKVEYL